MTVHFERTLEKLGQIADRLRQGGMSDVVYQWSKGISTSELTELEERLQMPLPASLSELIKRCGSLHLLWCLPQHCIVADEPACSYESSNGLEQEPNILDDIAGEFGWNHEYIGYFTSYGEDTDSAADEQRYLILNYNGAGDPILLDMATSATEPAVFCYDHELDQFTLLAENLPAYIETMLTLHGLWLWDWSNVSDEHGIQLNSPPLQLWQRWLDMFCTMKLEDAQSLETLIHYTTMHGVDHPAVLQAFQAYDPKDIFLAWEQHWQNIQHSQVPFSTWAVWIGETAGGGAADWVRSLWEPETAQVWTSLAQNNPLHAKGTFASTRAYLSARCLPEQEGLVCVCNHLLQHSVADGKLEGYTANGQLQHFHSPQVINWIRDKVNHPVDGWAVLFAYSCPTAEQVIEWLSSSELHQKIATEGLDIMIHRDLLPALEADAWANISDLLLASLQLVMLKKDKRRIEAVLKQLSDLELR
ncbi:SMI1/KNR4 family protein [Paenibacillus sp. CMM36]|uniref:SMI1/KNR4 family protein n=1 Tax=Paenibacillus polymyxa TaxID=1406 RepID=UPI00298BF785|nr:SMI1/KNR4 family protein [Paenibacillus polymyxa]